MSDHDTVDVVLLQQPGVAGISNSNFLNSSILCAVAVYLPFDCSVSLGEVTFRRLSVCARGDVSSTFPAFPLWVPSCVI